MHLPKKVPVANAAASRQRTLPRDTCCARASDEGIIMASKEVPTTVCCERSVINAMAGVTMVPPPIPSKPDRKPATLLQHKERYMHACQSY